MPYHPNSAAASAVEFVPKAYQQYIPSPHDNYTLASEGTLVRSNKPNNEISSICFDGSHELLWTGNAMGRISCHTVEDMKQILSFNDPSRSSIQQIDVYDDIVISVTSNAVAGYKRTGQPFFRAQLPNFQDLKCIHRPSTTQNIVFIGGKQNDLIIYDLEAQRDIKIISDESSAAITKIRSNHSNIFCANDKGMITIRSLNGEKLSDIQAHFGPITGFDICDNKLVTAGCTIKSGYNDPTPRGDPFLKVYDLRNMTAMQPISTPFPPHHVFFADSLNTGKIVLTSHFGRVWTTNINNNAATTFIHELPIYSNILHATLSSSYQTLAVVDNQQYCRMYSMYSNVRGCYGVINFNSRPLTPPNYHRQNQQHQQQFDGGGGYNNYDGIINSRDPMPFNGGKNYGNEYYNPTNNTVHDGTYGIQNLYLSNGINNSRAANGYSPYGHLQQQPQPPMPQKSRALTDALFVLRNATKGPIQIYSNDFFNDYEFRSEDLSLPEWIREEMGEKNIPRLYSRPTDKDRHDKFVYERFNNSTQVPLLNNSHAPIVNCVLRALSAVPVLKKAVLSHLCKKPSCMLCEIQFVLRNIHLQEQNNSIIPVTDSQKTYDGPIPEEDQFNKLMIIIQQTKEACNSCGSTEEYEKTRHITHLDYSKYFEPSQNVPFVELLETSFEQKIYDGGKDNSNNSNNKFSTSTTTTTTMTTATIQCRKCYRMAGKRRVSHTTILPPVLVIDTDITKNGYAFWVNHADPYNHRPTNSINSYDPRFVVRENSPNHQEWTSPPPTQTHPSHLFEQHHTVRGISNAVHSGGKWNHYLPSMMSVTIDPKDGRISFSVQISKQPNRKIYSLCSIVMTATDIYNPERFVAICKNQNPTTPLLNWTIFNDYIVTAVKEDEALYTNSKWKMPHLLFYCDIEHLNQTIDPVKIPREVFCEAQTHSKNLNFEQRASPPEEGEIVALDSEFIRNEQNENVLGRVSCLNKEGNILIDDYAMLGCGEKISDYLTQYSGIVQEDLDPVMSQKYLLSRKNTHLKVLFLVENKNIFIGHALHNDFKILNIYVPEEQIIDTCQLYRLEGRQFLSLRDLVKIVLGDEIQSERHDSVEDALCALRLFNKYNENKETNHNIQNWLQIIYDEAQRQSVSRQRYSPPSGTPRNYLLNTAARNNVHIPQQQPPSNSSTSLNNSYMYSNP